MYLDYWEFEEKPFENTPDPRFFFQSKQHRQAMSRLLYSIHEAKGAALLSGEYGCGKTTLIRTLINEIGDDSFSVILLTNPRWNGEELLREILYQMGADDIPEKKSEVLHRINDQLYDEVSAGRHTVLFVDEAQVIEDRDALEELRLLLNFQLNDRFMLTLILSGQPELREKLRELPQLVQRIAVKYHLIPLTLDETIQYVEYRLAVAGNLREEVFSADALAAIFEHSQGTPRTINNLCDLALAEGASEGVSVVRAELIRDIVESETAGGTFEW